jgi:hypothetical protein
MRRPRVVIPAVALVVVLIVAVLAIKSRGSDNKPLHTTSKGANCSPIARPDAVATKPGESVLIDVLANDTDPDGDPLVFQVLRTDGGTSTVSDGGTPTDSSDDRVQFTPADPPVDTGTINYQALDPQGGFGSSTVSIYVNPTGTLPDGVHPALATDPAPEGSSAGRCGGTTSTTLAQDSGVGPVGPETGVDEPTTLTTLSGDNGDSSGQTPVGRGHTTTTRRGARPTPTTPAGSPGTTGGNTPPTNPPATNPPPRPTTTFRTTTTRPSSPGTTAHPPPDCGPPQNTDAYRQCVKDHSGPSTTTPR